MATLHRRLRQLHQESSNDERVHVLLQFTGAKKDLAALADLGFNATSVAGNIAAGSIPTKQLQKLADQRVVKRIGGARPLKDEMDKSCAAIHLIEPGTATRSIPSLGKGAIVGVIDSGFDLIHPCFLDAKGKTRILAAWDQGNARKAEGRPPNGFDYGVEYTRDQINQSLTACELVIKNRSTGGKHGTNVAGIAAGNGEPNTNYIGVAPEAELIFVAYRNDAPMAGSAFVLDALEYIRRHARQNGKPVVINLSQGDNLGPHDGTSLLEQAIDHMVEKENVLIVNSAGNQRGQSHHVSGVVPPDREFALLFKLRGDPFLSAEPKPEVNGDEIEIWYDRNDRFSIALESPGGERSEFVAPDTAKTITLPGVSLNIDSEVNHPGNQANRINILLEKGEGWKVGTGTWKVILKGDRVSNGKFHAWTDRPNDESLIRFSRASDEYTITTPGTSKHIITVSSFVSRPIEDEDGDVEGGLSPLTSLGPTRDERPKPDLTAPGMAIFAPGVHQNGDGKYAPAMGTSMAAPHVAGVLALLLSARPDIKALEAKALLQSAAGFDMFTGVIPSSDWGPGKLDARAGFHALSKYNPKEE